MVLTLAAYFIGQEFSVVAAALAPMASGAKRCGADYGRCTLPHLGSRRYPLDCHHPNWIAGRPPVQLCHPQNRLYLVRLEAVRSAGVEKYPVDASPSIAQRQDERVLMVLKRLSRRSFSTELRRHLPGISHQYPVNPHEPDPYLLCDLHCRRYQW